jgi:putative heme transporter
VAALIAFGGPEAGSAAAVFLYRGFTYVMEIPLGIVGWAIWGLRSSWRRPLTGLTDDSSEMGEPGRSPG